MHYDTPEDGKADLHRSGRTARAGAAGLVVSLVGHGDTRTVSRMQRDLEIPAPMTPPNVSEIGVSHGQPKVRVAPNKPLSVVASDDAAPRERPARPQRRNGERYNGERSSASVRGNGRPNRGRPPSRRAS